MAFIYRSFVERDFWKMLLMGIYTLLAVGDAFLPPLFFKGYLLISYIIFLLFKIVKHFVKNKEHEKYRELFYKSYKSVLKISKKELEERANKDKSFNTICVDCINFDKEMGVCSLKVEDKNKAHLFFIDDNYRRKLCLLWNKNLPLSMKGKFEYFQTMTRDVDYKE